MGTGSRKLRLTCSIIGLLFAIIVFLVQRLTEPGPSGSRCHSPWATMCLAGQDSGLIGQGTSFASILPLWPNRLAGTAFARLDCEGDNNPPHIDAQSSPASLRGH